MTRWQLQISGPPNTRVKTAVKWCLWWEPSCTHALSSYRTTLIMRRWTSGRWAVYSIRCVHSRCVSYTYSNIILHGVMLDWKKYISASTACVSVIMEVVKMDVISIVPLVKFSVVNHWNAKSNQYLIIILLQACKRINIY